MVPTATYSIIASLALVIAPSITAEEPTVPVSHPNIVKANWDEQSYAATVGDPVVVHYVPWCNPGYKLWRNGAPLGGWNSRQKDDNIVCYSPRQQQTD
jgi:hypothetical protein